MFAVRLDVFLSCSPVMADAEVGHKPNIEINIEILDGSAYDTFCSLIRDLHITCIKDGAALSFLESLWREYQVTVTLPTTSQWGAYQLTRR
jgi:hypothetical protein